VLAALLIAAAASVASLPPGSEPPDAIELGRSVEDRPITAVHRPDPDGDGVDAVTVVVIGVIHGDEPAGLDIVSRLHDLPLTDDVELYLIDAMNPDGLAADTRGNANGVDLNRNFPYNWGPIGGPGDGQYAGPEAASEPETRAITAFLGEHHPALVIWYHQDLFMVPPAQGREGEIRTRYAELTALPMASPTGGTYTGVAATWARNELAANQPEPGVAFIVELGPTLSPEEADTHASAVLTIATEIATARAATG
jgi:murein peptide amidase A